MSLPDARRRKISKRTLIAVGLSVLAVITFVTGALTTADRWIGYAAGGAALAIIAARILRRGPYGDIAVQVLITAGFLASYHRGPDEYIAVAGVVILALLLNQGTFKRVANKQILAIANLPHAHLNSAFSISPATVPIATTALVISSGVAGALRLPTWLLGAAALVVAIVSVIVLAQMAINRSRTAHAAEIVNRALMEYAPEFAIYFSAPTGSQYQIESWLPHHEALRRKFILVVREQWAFPILSAATKAPVVLARTVATVENIVVPSLRAVFYVNNGMKNSHMVRFNHLTHIQLLHGDSDKSPSFNPVTAMFDRVYVAGQAGIDRYAANGVFLDPAKFVIVGRPQVASVEIAVAPIRDIPAVLYAPTWAGYFTDSNHSSLRIGREIIEELIRRGATVIFRPHPHTDRNAETKARADEIEALLAADAATSHRHHLFGPLARERMSLTECFNASDAMVADVSGVVSDYLYSEKPFAMTHMSGDGAELDKVFPLSRAAYVLRHDGSNLAELLDAMFGDDPMARLRRQTKVYYLGDFPPETYADGFVRAALSDLEQKPVVDVGTTPDAPVVSADTVG